MDSVNYNFLIWCNYKANCQTILQDVLNKTKQSIIIYLHSTEKLLKESLTYQ